MFLQHSWIASPCPLRGLDDHVHFLDCIDLFCTKSSDDKVQRPDTSIILYILVFIFSYVRIICLMFTL